MNGERNEIRILCGCCRDLSNRCHRLCSSPLLCGLPARRVHTGLHSLRKTISTKKRLELFQSHSGLCHICGGKIQVGEAWELEHKIALAMGGDDDETNWAPAHVKCHRAKSREDFGNIARAKRREARHLGIKKSRNPLPGGRSSPWKRTMDGRVVRRDGQDG